MKGKLAVVSLALILLAGCISTGRDFDAALVRNIKNGTTTRTQLQSWFGYPYMTGVDDGDEAWTYNFSRTVSSGQTLTKNLYIVFTDTGIVKSFTFSTSFPEEMGLPK